MTQVMLTREAIDQWPRRLLGAGWRVLAPVAVNGDVEYYELTSKAAEPTGFGKGLARQSPKESWFPRSEPILKFHRNSREWSMDDPEMGFPPVVVFGARPCDAAAPQILAPLFGWDLHDPFFEQRLKKLAFVVLACQKPVDDACFCTSVGVDPAGQNCGDAILTELADGSFVAEACTETGQQLLASMPQSQAAEPAELAALREKIRQSVPVRFQTTTVEAALRRRFDDPLWEKAARSCLACGTCAFVCPTCHCFDIQDEMTGGEGVRQKNWDACAFPLFTLHTSGHNPRSEQSSRWRQRLSHKFRYYPEKFSKVLCTGCGRCIRLCPAGMDLLADLRDLSQNPGPESSVAPAATGDHGPVSRRAGSDAWRIPEHLPTLPDARRFSPRRDAGCAHVAIGVPRSEGGRSL